jgi:hypothetical protein
MDTPLIGKTHTAAMTAAATTDELRQHNLARLLASEARIRERQAVIAAETPDERRARIDRIQAEIAAGTYPASQAVDDTINIMFAIRERLAESERRKPAEYQDRQHIEQGPDDERDQ